MSTLIGLAPFLNMWPHTRVAVPEGFGTVAALPAEALVGLADGSLLAAAVPVGGLAALAGLVSPLGAFGIAAFGAVGSVLLFSMLPLLALDSACRVLLPSESASSVRLLPLLLADRLGWERLPRPCSTGPAEALLAIGDAALTLQAQGRYPYVYDLAALWTERHGLPFVFARWVARRELAAAQRGRLVDWLERCAGGKEILTVDQLAAAPLPVGVTPAAGLAYLAGIHYRLGAAAAAGEALFLAELQRHQAAIARWAPFLEGAA